MFALGALKLGSVIRFVSWEVMSGIIFLSVLLIILGQYKDLVGYASSLETNKLFKARDVTLHVGDWSMYAALVGFASILILALLKQSPLKKWAEIIIILVATPFMVLTKLQGVELVGGIAKLPMA